MPADGQTAKFLYTILKQLDLKSVGIFKPRPPLLLSSCPRSLTLVQIDWNLVASQLEITNGHAARMRFSRFKQHMEGTTTAPRTPRPKKEKPAKGDCKKRALEDPKPEQDDAETEACVFPRIKRECRDGDESIVANGDTTNGDIFPLTSASRMQLALRGTPYPSDPPVLPFPYENQQPFIKLEPEDVEQVEVKAEPKE